MLLRCKASKGQFQSEVAISGAEYNGTEFSLFADLRFVECDILPEDGRPVDALLRVVELEREGSLVLISLPGQTLANGKTITVNAEALEECQACQEA
jgi:hypothetical protein